MSVVQPPPGAAAQLAPVLAAGGPELSWLLQRTESRLAEVGSSHGAELGRHAGKTLSAGGKRLRPLLVFLCAVRDGLGEDDDTKRLVAAGAAVELLHMATLVHDDVLDRAALRRGHPTVYAEGGRPAATATGDLLFSRAFAELASTGSQDAVRTLSTASSALACGELMQRSDAWSGEVTPARYRQRCQLKTASLFEAACQVGALIGGTPEHAPALARFGQRVGIAFQIFDDVLDVSGPTERTGKPRGADLLDGTVTLPLILAWRRDEPLRSLDIRTGVTERAQVEALCERIARTGALGEARDAAFTEVAEAKQALADLDLPGARRRALELVADGVVARYG